MNRPKVLNLSDIHHNNPFNDKVDIRNTSYFDSIKKVINSIEPTHIVVNGDMVFSAKMDQYTNCYNTLFHDYLEKNKETRFITIPGNHSCNRIIPQLLLKYSKVYFDDKKLEIDLESLSGMQKFEKTIKEIINKGDVRKEFVAALINEGLDMDYVNYFSDDKVIDLFDILFYDYKRFTEEYVIQRLEDINDLKKESILSFKSYKKSGGLHGIIHDKEYNIAFACLNSVSYFWGEETYEELYSTGKLKTRFNEYGKLSFGDSDRIVNKELDNMYRKNVLDHTIVCLISHVPLSWISYESQFKFRTDFSEIFDKSDLALFGHIHVRHYEPTKYRNHTWVFESPQLFDYHLDDMRDADIDNNIIDTLGFSHFNFFSDNSRFTHYKYSLKEGTKFTKNKYNEYEFKWGKPEEKSYSYDNTKRSFVSCYDCINANSYQQIFSLDFLGEKCKYRSSLNTHAKKDLKYSGNSFKITSDLEINLTQLSIEFLKSLINDKLTSDHIIGLDIKEETLNLLFDIKPSLTTEDIFTVLESFICSLDEETLKKVKIIRIYFFDYALFYIFGQESSEEKNKKNDLQWENLFQKWIFMLHNMSIHFKTRIYSGLPVTTGHKVVTPLCTNASSELVKLGIDFDVLIFKDYKDFIIKNC